MVRLLALCLAALMGTVEGVAVRLQEQHELNAGLLHPAGVPAETHHDMVVDGRPAVLRRLLSAIKVKSSMSMIPSDSIETVEHQKARGNGYKKGSPLYERSQAFKNASAIASLAKEAQAPHDPGSPSYVATAFMLFISISCLGAAHIWAGTHHGPPKDITTGPMMPPNTGMMPPNTGMMPPNTGSMMPHSEASLEESMHVPGYGSQGRQSFVPPTASMPPGSMPPGSMPTGTMTQPFGSSMAAGSMQQPGPFGSSRDPLGMSSMNPMGASARSRSPPARPTSPTASSNTPSQGAYPSMGQVHSPTHSQGSAPQVPQSSWHALPTQAMPPQGMPVSPMGGQALPTSPMPTGGFGN